ncbi:MULTISPECIES: hypothetical protein [unclassified Pseudomonas]|uniref:hypothetical protein n=1 Tax=unclassified Pseudomonas TaxID=196821 RepID=UPI001CB75877|nr:MULTISPECIES: hypothetical protein [unclassified Pseudomonas]
MAATVEQLSVSITHIADNAKQAQSTAQKAGQITNDGMAVMQESIQEMGHIANLVAQSSSDIDRPTNLPCRAMSLFDEPKAPEPSARQ